MKKIFKIVLMIGILFSLNAVASGELNKKEMSEIEKLPIFTGSGMHIIKAYKDEQFYLLRVNIQENIQELVLTADKNFLIAGKVYNTASGEELSIPNDVSILDGKEALTYGTGKDVYYLFTDPECPYCKKFESYFEDIKKDVQLKIFFFPLSFHKNAVALTQYILDNKTNAAKVDAMMNVTVDSKEFKNKKYSDKQKTSLNKIIAANMKLGEELGVRGTPALFDMNGKALSWVNVLQRYGVEVK
ncbi:MAG: DsbC family protein [Arcobacter sp.]|uniref:DsbC family protein n=1 Tax=Arcobacter sp. TaxID=1872629 RepID=UPI003B0092C4